MSRFIIFNPIMAPLPDLDGYCSFSWSLCERGEEIEKKLEEMAKRTSDERCSLPNEHSIIMKNVLLSVENMNEMLKKWYKYNEKLYNSVMDGAYYENGEKHSCGTLWQRKRVF